MNERRLGRTGLSVSEIGYGAWGIGGDMWLGAQDDESVQALHRAIDLGLNFIDTALAYGRGHSEKLVGQVVRERERADRRLEQDPAEEPRVAGARTAIDPDDAFPAEHVRKCTERTLSNLGMDALDVQQFHVWSDEWVGRGSWLEAIEALKDEGKIRFFGVSINDHQPSNAIKLIETGAVDTVQVIYNVFDQSPEDGLLAACERNDVGVIVRVPFDEGALTGRIGPGHASSRRATSATTTSAATGSQQVERARRGDPRRPRDRARRAAGDGAALHPQPPRGLDRDPGHAHGAQRRAQLRGRRRRRAAARAGGGAQGPPLGSQLLRGLSLRDIRPVASTQGVSRV